jgi:PAS domain S-box-containing protein
MPAASVSLHPFSANTRAVDNLRALNLSHNPAFERLTRLVARALKVPVSLFSLIDDDYQWLVSSVGLPEALARITPVPRSESICQYVIANNQPLIVSDARQDPVLRAIKAVQRLGVAAYAGVPLTMADGHTIGVLCAYDYVPREWTDDDIETLQDVSLSVTTEAELSLRLRDYEEVKEKLAQERDLLRALIDTFPDYIFVKDSEGRFVISNRAHAEAAKIDDPEQLVGKTAFDTFPPELAEQYDADDRAVIDSGEPLLNLERQTIDPEGKRKWVLTSKVPFKSSDGKMTGLVGISRDITQRRQAEEALRERERFIEQILTTSPSVVYLYDLEEQRNIYSNLEIAAALGYSPEEIDAFANRLFAELMHPDDLAELPAHLVRLMLLKDGQVLEHEYRMRHKDGEYRWLYSRDIIFLRDSQGRPKQTIGAALDITAMKRAEAALRDSEQRLRAVINYAPILLIELDASGVFTLSEGRGLSALGIAPGVINGQSAFSVLAHLPQITTRIARSLGGETVEFIHDDAHTVMQMSFTPQFDEEGQLMSVIGVGLDVTEQVRALDAVASANARLKLLRDVDAQLTESLDLQRVLAAAMRAAVNSVHASDGCIALMEDNQLRIVESVGGYESQTQLPGSKSRLAEIIRSQQTVRIDDLRAEKKNTHALNQSGSQLMVPLSYGDRSIGVLNLESSRDNAFDEDSIAFIKSLAVRTAVAIENARLYLLSQTQLVTLQELYDKVRSLEQIKTDMIRIAAHDLRNPLTAANGLVSMLQDELRGTLSDAQRDHLDMLSGSLRAMQKIISDILSLQRIEALQEQTQYSIVDLLDVVADTFDKNRRLAQHKHLEFELEVPAEALKVRGDAAQLREAIDNLIHNAIKYTPEGGYVTVRLVSEHTHVVFEVQDTGYGIPAALQGRLFQPFFRAKTAQTRQIEGTGLGLHLVKNIIDRHAGKMRFVSEQGKGSTFGFELPLLTDDVSA